MHQFIYYRRYCNNFLLCDTWKVVIESTSVYDVLCCLTDICCLINNCRWITCTSSDALTLAKKAGTDPELVYQAIRGGLAGSTVLDAKAPMMMDRNFKPGFRIELHIKDLNNALNAGHAVSAPLPLTGELMEIMQALKADGHEKEDHSSIVKFYEKIGNVTVTRD